MRTRSRPNPIRSKVTRASPRTVIRAIAKQKHTSSFICILPIITSFPIIISFFITSNFIRFSPTRRIKEITDFLFIIDTTFKSILNRKFSMKFSITNSNYIIIIFSPFNTISSIFKSRNKCSRTPSRIALFINN